MQKNKQIDGSSVGKSHDWLNPSSYFVIILIEWLELL